MQIKSYCAYELGGEEPAQRVASCSRDSKQAVLTPCPLLTPLESRGELLAEIRLLGMYSYIPVSCLLQNPTGRISLSASTAVPAHPLGQHISSWADVSVWPTKLGTSLISLCITSNSFCAGPTGRPLNGYGCSRLCGAIYTSS